MSVFKPILIFALFSLLQSGTAQASPEDTRLKAFIRGFHLKSPKTIPNTDHNKYEFGKRLFSDTKLSLNHDISCKTCHNPELGSADGLPFSIGTGGMLEGKHRQQLGAEITSRSAPHLYNKGHSSIRTMFWDGRILFQPTNNSYQTPDEDLNGTNPKLNHITDTIENVLAMQALFPIVNNEEMCGPTCLDVSNIEVWQEIETRIKNDKSYKKYVSEFSDFNIGHIANALSYFQTIEFQVNDTPFDRYVQGDLNALSQVEKEGAVLFMDKGRCVQCHNGELLTNLSFQSVSVPQIGKGQTHDHNDEGRYLIYKHDRFKYSFLVQPLRNIALTAPFMHNGAYSDLKAVVNHYNNPSRAIDVYGVGPLQDLYRHNYNEFIFVDKNPYTNFYRKQSLASLLNTPLGLSKDEVNKLVCFLKKSLTQEKFYRQLTFKECL